MKTGKKETFRTFETRVRIDQITNDSLQACAFLFSKVQHHLFADISSGKEGRSLKNDYLVRYQITARHFNAIYSLLEGKISSIKERRPALIAEKKERIKSLEKKISSKKKPSDYLHQKKRRLARLKKELEVMEEDHKKGIARLCFGSKKLFHAQFALEENGYKNHEEWWQEWQKARSKELFFLGSKDETSGNQSCTATIEPDESLTLRIRMPDALVPKHGKYVHIRNIKFSYGHKEILKALRACIAGNKQAITWRMVRDDKSWRIFASCEVQPAPCISKKELGVVGLDINSDHLALVETDRFGNPIHKETFPMPLYGKSKSQSSAIIGDLAAEVIAFAEKAQKPLVIEDLDFQKKKTALRENKTTSFARMLSSFAYQSLVTHLKSRGSKKGIEVMQVNPAYTSIIGRVKFAKRYGLSVHHAAALTIGRRCLKFSEKPPSRLDIPDGKEGYVTLPYPQRNRAKHVWHFWRQLSKKFSAVLAAHFRTAKADPRALTCS